MIHHPFDRWEYHPIGCDCPECAPQPQLTDFDRAAIWALAFTFGLLIVAEILHHVLGWPGLAELFGAHR